MTDREIHTALYEKAFSEQEAYRNWLLRQDPEEILAHAGEYTVREDILLELKSCPPDRETAELLLASPGLLADLYHRYCKIETGFPEEIRGCISFVASRIRERASGGECLLHCEQK